MPADPPALTDRFLVAVRLANELHGGRRRLGTEIPYVAHLLIVTGLVLEEGGDEDVAIAALLHDAVEDAGGQVVLDRIRGQFGERVASVVAQLSDSLDADDERSWRARKAAYLEHLPAVTDEAVLLIALADKVHNARSIVRDYRAEGHALWERFTNKTAEDQLWYYGELLEFFRTRGSGPLVEDLDRAVSELAELVARDPAAPDADRP